MGKQTQIMPKTTKIDLDKALDMCLNPMWFKAHIYFSSIRIAFGFRPGKVKIKNSRAYFEILIFSFS